MNKSLSENMIGSQSLTLLGVAVGLIGKRLPVMTSSLMNMAAAAKNASQSPPITVLLSELPPAPFEDLEFGASFALNAWPESLATYSVGGGSVGCLTTVSVSFLISRAST